MSTKVIFRRWKTDPKSVIALFPEIPHDIEGRYCESYEHIGQHGGANYILLVTRETAPATEQEYIPLLVELQRIGYDDLEIYKRRTPQMLDTFSERLREHRKED